MPTRLDEIGDHQVVRAERNVREHGFVLASKLLSERTSAKAQGELIEALTARGLERAPRGVRVPLGEQLEGALAAARELPMAGLQKRLAGATAKDAKAAAHALVRAGRAVIVKKGRGEVLLPRDERSLAPAELGALERGAKLLKSALGRLERALKSTRATRTRPALSLLRGDAQSFADELRAAGDALFSLKPTTEAPPPQPVPAPRAARDPDSVARVIRAARDLEIDGLGLVYVPDLVRALCELGPSGVHDALREAATAGRIELRPESGLDRLPDDERAACLVGPSGKLVSYVRLR